MRADKQKLAAEIAESLRQSGLLLSDYGTTTAARDLIARYLPDEADTPRTCEMCGYEQGKPLPNVEGTCPSCYRTYKTLDCSAADHPVTEPLCNESHPKGTPCPVEGKRSVPAPKFRDKVDALNVGTFGAEPDVAALSKLLDLAYDLADELDDERRPISDYTGAY